MVSIMDLLGDVTSDLMNLFRARRPPVRISLQLGDLDAVFEDVTTVHGKKQRLQALGCYYEEITPANASTVTEAYTKCLAYWINNRNTLIDADADLQFQVRNMVVKNNILPVVGNEGSVNLPGGFCYRNINELGNQGAAANGALPSHRYNAEVSYWGGDLMLGMIPLIALVEQQSTDGSWSPLPDAWVHFQLIPPFHDNAGAELTDVNALRNQSEQGTPLVSNIVANTGPRPFINAAITHLYDATDPQRYNAHTSRGGKRGDPVMGNVAKDLPATGFPNFNPIEASSHDHAVRGQSNGTGEVGISFSPSFIGGDRYRWRVFVDPVSGRESDGTEGHSVKFETGSFCVKKHTLWSGLVSKPNPILAAQNTVLGIQERLWALRYDTGPRDGLIGSQTRRGIRAFQTNHAALPQSGQPGRGSNGHAATQVQLNTDYNTFIARGGGPVGNLDFAFIRGEFDSMYCDLEIEPSVQAATPLLQADYTAAIQWARSQIQATPPAGLSRNYNFNVVFEDYFNTPFLIDIKDPRYYNRTRGPGFPRVPRGAVATAYQTYWMDMVTAIYGTGGLLEQIFLYFSGQASVASPPNANINGDSNPGVTVITASRASPMMLTWNAPGNSVVPTGQQWRGTYNASGIGGNRRACTVFYGNGLYNNWPYQGDGFSRNAMHEMGHVLYMRHHRTSAAGGGFPADHDTSDRCVMGYLFCEGQFCGKCHLKIRGWDISQLAP